MIRGVAVIIGIACLLLLAAINGEVAEIAAFRTTSHTFQFCLLLLGVVLLSWGVLMSRGGPRLPLYGFWLITITLLGFVLRMWRVDSAVHFYVDEVNFVEGILRLRDEPNIKLLGPFNYIAAFTWVYPWLQMQAADIFGPNLMALRSVSVFFGTVTIPAVYALGRWLFNRKVGLLAALLLAVYPPHIHFSRLGLNNIADPFFGTLALALLVRGLRKNQLADYALAGVMLGLTQYFYEGGRLFYPALMLFWGVTTTVIWRGSWRGLLICGGLAAVVALPVYFTLAAWDISFTSRLNMRGLKLDYWGVLLLSTAEDGYLWQHIRIQILRPLLHFITLPDQSRFYYGGNTALILPHLLPVAMAGLLTLRRQAVAVGLVAGAIVLTILGNSLIDYNVWTARYVVAFPAVTLLLALGLHNLHRIVSWRWPGLPPSFYAGLLLVVCASQVGYYFGPHLSMYQTQIRPQHDQQDIAFRIRDLPPGTKTYLITDDTDVYLPALVFLSRYWGIPEIDLQVRHPASLENWAALDHLWWGVGHAFFVEQDDLTTQGWLRERFHITTPGQLSPYPVPSDKQYLLLYYQPAAPFTP